MSLFLSHTQTHKMGTVDENRLEKRSKWSQSFLDSRYTLTNCIISEIVILLFVLSFKAKVGYRHSVFKQDDIYKIHAFETQR